MKVENIGIDIPHFPGFYNSTLYSQDYDCEEERNFIQSEIYENHEDFPEEIIEEYMQSVNYSMYPVKLDFEKYCEDTAKKFSECFEHYIQKQIPSFKVIFKRVWSPSFYNYQTDRIEADVSFENDEVKKYLKENKDDFKKFLEENVRRHYIEDNREEFEPEYYFDIDEDEKQESYYFSILVERIFAFIFENEYGEDGEFEICCDVLENISLFCYYDVKQEFSDFFDSEKAEEIAKEYKRLKKQGEDYLEVMKDEKYIPVVKENMKNIVNEFVEEMEEWISNRD